MGKTAHGLLHMMGEKCWEQAEERRGGGKASGVCVLLSPVLERLVRRLAAALFSDSITKCSSYSARAAACLHHS
jgi:hypothetical protein